MSCVTFLYDKKRFCFKKKFNGQQSMQNANAKFRRNTNLNLRHETCRSANRHYFLYNALYVEKYMIIYHPVTMLLFLSNSKHFPTLKSFYVNV
jgi:hypothetical protein